jgi:hypothetical protein
MPAFTKKPWTIAALAVAAIFYVGACSTALYELTSPPSLSWHVALRKAYSIVAFALVGYFFRRASAENGGRRFVVPIIVAVAAYSAAIEVGQYVLGSKEGLGWNTFDTLCGALGGALATTDVIVRRASSLPGAQAEGRGK